MRKVLYLLASFEDSDIDWLVHNGERRTVPTGESIIVEGQPIDALYIVLKGRMVVTIGREDPTSLGSLRAGEMVGELSFLDRRPPTATVTSVEESVLFSIPKGRLEQRLEAEPLFAARFYRTLGVFLATRLRSTTLILGHGKTDSLGADVEGEDELSLENLDDADRGALRFQHILQELLQA